MNELGIPFSIAIKKASFVFKELGPIGAAVAIVIWTLMVYGSLYILKHPRILPLKRRLYWAGATLLACIVLVVYYLGPFSMFPVATVLIIAPAMFDRIDSYREDIEYFQRQMAAGKYTTKQLLDLSEAKGKTRRKLKELIGTGGKEK